MKIINDIRKNFVKVRYKYNDKKISKFTTNINSCYN